MKNKGNQLLSDFFASCQNGLRAAKSAPHRKALDEFGLNLNRVEVGFNSGQFHHRESDEFKDAFVKAGILTKSSTPVNDPDRTAYTCFGKESLTFPLRNEDGEVVNFFAYRLKVKSDRKHYLNNQGLFPGFPSENTKRLYFTTDVFDAATMMSACLIPFDHSVIALDEGEFSEKHLKALSIATELEEIIFLCPQGEALTLKIKEYGGISVRFINAYTGGLCVNEFFLNHGAKGLHDYIESKRYEDNSVSQLNTENPLNLHKEGEYGSISVLGGIDSSVSERLDVDLFYSPHGEIKRKRIRVDLLDYESTDLKVDELSRRLQFDKRKILEDLDILRSDLVDYRDDQFARLYANQSPKIIENQGRGKNESIEFLKQPNLLNKIDKCIEHSGLVGEQKSRLLCFLIGVSHFTDYPLHGIVKGSSGSGKSQLVNHIKSLMPDEKVKDYTSGSNQTMSYYGDELENKFVVIQDFDGFTSKMQYDFRELQSNLSITRAFVDRDDHGKNYTREVTVTGGFSSLGASTKNVYHDNETRSILISVDESKGQTLAIQQKQNRNRAGLIDHEKEEKSRTLLRNCIRNLKSYKVINPFATQVELPFLNGLRRLNNQFHDLVSVIAIFSQYNREIDKNGYLIAQYEDVQQTIDIFFESIMIKADDLDAITRTFYNNLLVYIESSPKGFQTSFKVSEIRRRLGMKQTTVNNRIKTLHHMGYLQVVGGTKNKGYEYKLDISDSIERKRDEIKEVLSEQLLKTNENQMNTTAQ